MNMRIRHEAIEKILIALIVEAIQYADAPHDFDLPKYVGDILSALASTPVEGMRLTDKEIGNAIWEEFRTKQARIEERKEIGNVLELTEKTLDDTNAAYGCEEQLCIYCHSKRADGSGIVHNEGCPILIIRKSLRREKE